MMRQIEVSVDVFAGIWSARLPHEVNEDQILARLLKLRARTSSVTGHMATEPIGETPTKAPSTRAMPMNKKWTSVLTWTLEQFGGRATLAEIYRKSREGRSELGLVITAEHDASARECLESHCKDSSKFRGKADLFYMPEGKGAGIWALR